MLFLDFCFEDTIQLLVLRAYLALICGKVVTPAYTTEGALIECLGEGVVSEQNVALLSINLSVKIHIESHDTNYVKDKVGGVYIQAERLPARSLLCHELHEGFGLVEDSIDKAEQMLRLKSRPNSFIQSIPLVALE